MPNKPTTTKGQQPKKGITPSLMLGFALALVEMGLPMIGVNVNIYLGAIILTVAFVFLAYGFWQWEKAGKWNRIARVSTVVVLGLIYFALVGFQIHAQYRKDHPIALAIASPQQFSPASVTPSTLVNSWPAPPATAVVPAKQSPTPTFNANVAAGIQGSDNTVVGNVPARPINGNGNTIVGATDDHGNTILNRGGTAIGAGAHADPTSIAIGAGALAGQQPPTYQQNCVGSACAQGPGSQATLNQFGAIKLSMTDTQRAAIRDAMKPYAGIKITIFCHDATPDSSEYAKQLATAFREAGITVDGPSFGTQFRAGSGVPPGLSATFSKDLSQAAEALGKVLVDEGLAKPPLNGGINLNAPASSFDITIAPNR